MTSATLGFGALLKRGDGASPEVFTTIGECRDITISGMTVDTVEATHQESPSAVKEFIAGLRDGGEISFELNYLPANATHDASTGLLSRFAGRNVDNYQLVWPDTAGTTWTLPCLLTQFEPTAPVQDRLAANVTLKVMSEPTLA